jgi:hypothetical protein
VLQVFAEIHFPDRSSLLAGPPMPSYTPSPSHTGQAVLWTYVNRQPEGELQEDWGCVSAVFTATSPGSTT